MQETEYLAAYDRGNRERRGLAMSGAKILLPRGDRKRWQNLMKILMIQNQKGKLWDISEERDESDYQSKDKNVNGNEED